MEMPCLLTPRTTTLKPLDAIFHSAIQFFTHDSCHTHHCKLYEKVVWSSQTSRWHQHTCVLCSNNHDNRSWDRFKRSSHQSWSGEDCFPVLCTVQLEWTETHIPVGDFRVAALKDYVLLFILFCTSHTLHSLCIWSETALTKKVNNFSLQSMQLRVIFIFFIQ